MLQLTYYKVRRFWANVLLRSLLTKFIMRFLAHLVHRCHGDGQQLSDACMTWCTNWTTESLSFVDRIYFAAIAARAIKWWMRKWNHISLVVVSRRHLVTWTQRTWALSTACSAGGEHQLDDLLPAWWRQQYRSQSHGLSDWRDEILTALSGALVNRWPR